MSNYNGYAGAAAQTAHSHHEIRSLESSVEDLSRQVRDLDEFKDEAEQKLYELEGLDSKMESVESDVADLNGEVAALTTRVAWLERVIAQAGLVPAADWDKFGRDERALAAAVVVGWMAAGKLMSQWERSANERLVAQVEGAGVRNREAVAGAAAAVETMGAAAVGTAEYSLASTNFRRLQAEISTSAAFHGEHAEKAREAEAKLAEDDAVRKAVATDIKAGLEAEANLRTRLRTRIVDQLGRNVLVPSWFAESFGPAAPAGKWAETWYNTATEVLFFRLVYKVTDPDKALGTKSSASGLDQAERRRQLSEKLRRLPR